MVAYRYALARARLPRSNDHALVRAMIILLDTLIMRVKISAQAMWRMLRADPHPLLAIVIIAADTNPKVEVLVREEVRRSGLSEDILDRWMTLTRDSEDRLLGIIPGQGNLILTEPEERKPDIMRRRKMANSYRAVSDQDFKRRYFQNLENGNTSKF